MNRKMHCVSVLVLFLLVLSLVSMLPTSGNPGLVEYDKWADLNLDGVIDIQDLVGISGHFTGEGTPMAGIAGLEYVSGWINITDKQGQYFNITHNLNSTNLIVQVTGKKQLSDGPHQKNIGGEGYLTYPPINKTYGWIYPEFANAVVQTYDGGYAIAGYTTFPTWDSWLARLDNEGRLLWTSTYGGSNEDLAYDLIETDDGGFALGGYTSSYGAGLKDFWLVKTDASGNAMWNRTYGGVGDDVACSLVQTQDGGYALAGYTNSIGSGAHDVWLVRTSSTGLTVWSRSYGGAGEDYAYSLVATTDDGFAFCGSTSSSGAGSLDAYLVRTDNLGNPLWTVVNGGVAPDEEYCIIQTQDGGFAVAGYTRSFGSGGADMSWMKLDSNGNINWTGTYGGATPMDQLAYSLAQTSDGGYDLAGYNKQFSVLGDAWLVRIDPTGQPLWNRTYTGGNGDEWAHDVVITADDGYALACVATSPFSAGGIDAWLLKFDANGGQTIGESYEHGLVWTASTPDTIILYRGRNDLDWNYISITIWKPKTIP